MALLLLVVMTFTIVSTTSANAATKITSLKLYDVDENAKFIPLSNNEIVDCGECDSAGIKCFFFTNIKQKKVVIKAKVSNTTLFKAGTDSINLVGGVYRNVFTITTKKTINKDVTATVTVTAKGKKGKTLKKKIRVHFSKAKKNNKSDVSAINNIIKEQKEQGAKVKSDLSSEQYNWTDGRLTAIYWEKTGLTGDMDLSKLDALETVYVYENELTSLDVSGCNKLTDLSCSSNKLETLNVKGCTSIKELSCSWNQINNLDVSDCREITELECEDNHLTELDLSNCTKLNTLYCEDNQIKEIDLTNCPNIEYAFCDYGVNKIGYSKK